MRGRFITFEGGEGVGKSTHILALSKRLSDLGIEVVVTREPGGTPLCEHIRGMLQFDAAGESPTKEAETLLFCASRAQLVSKVIMPALERGAWVLSDRFTDSTLAYQGYGRGLDLDSLKSLLQFATRGLSPDMTFLLEVSSQVENERLKKRYDDGTKPDRFEREKDEFHSRVRDGFSMLATAEPSRIKRVLTEGTVEETSNAIWNEVSSFIR